jgi:hypothetical protein
MMKSFEPGSAASTVRLLNLAIAPSDKGGKIRQHHVSRWAIFRA